jgi:glyoxylase-like metal-dependent hydrolase (beta-lactamase superfamily II)/ferredoxin
MAAIGKRRPENVAGDFFVDSTCIDCDQCRQIAPASFTQAGDQSAVLRQPATPGETRAALEALVTCPVGSIGTTTKVDIRPGLESFPKPVEGEVHFCGFAAESSFGASSYLIVRPAGNVLVDSPRFAAQLVRRIEAVGGLRTILLTHQDDVADHAKWAARLGATRVLHRDDYSSRFGPIERLLEGTDPIQLDEDLVVIPTPGHTRGHVVYLYRNRFLFTGDHMWWSPNRRRLHASRSVSWYSWTEQTRSMRRLLDFDFEWVLPGHGWRLHAPASEMHRQVEDCVTEMEGRLSRRRAS